MRIDTVQFNIHTTNLFNKWNYWIEKNEWIYSFTKMFMGPERCVWCICREFLGWADWVGRKGKHLNSSLHPSMQGSNWKSEQLGINNELVKIQVPSLVWHQVGNKEENNNWVSRPWSNVERGAAPSGSVWGFRKCVDRGSWCWAQTGCSISSSKTPTACSLLFSQLPLKSTGSYK